jgi:putative YpdA family bacillithiol system oxidoreductase
MLALAMLCAYTRARIDARRRARPAPASRPPLIHSINDDRCIGCDACVEVCPTDVLELVNNKSRVQRFSDCVQCEQCAHACPTTALVMHYKGSAPPGVRVPLLDEHYQAAPGLYLIGEAAGKPLVKNASNLGRAAIEHMIKSGLKPSAGDSSEVDVLDVVIVGSGPGGLSAALSCVARGLSYTILEKDELVCSTVARYPKGKRVMAEPYDVRCLGLLPVWDSDKDELLAAWQKIMAELDITICTHETVDEVQRSGDIFAVTTSRRQLRAKRVLLAIGTRGQPRRLGVPGEELPNVSPLLTDAELHRGQHVLVVGGGDSAVEAAVSLARTAAQVTLSYRGKALSRCKTKNRWGLHDAVARERVLLRFESKVQEIRPRSVVLQVENGNLEIENDHVFVCIGGEAPVRWLERAGVRFGEQPHSFQRGATDRLVESLIGPCDEAPHPGVPTPRRPLPVVISPDRPLSSRVPPPIPRDCFVSSPGMRAAQGNRTEETR